MPPERFNSAYLIDSHGLILLSQKSCNDSQGGYRVRRFFKAVSHRGWVVASLICADAYTDKNCVNEPFHARIAKKLHQCKGRVIMAVPAHLTSTATMPEVIISNLAQHFPTIAFANSSANHKSLICSGEQLCEYSPERATENWIAFAPLP
jgi:hypothetical protein